MVQTQTKLIPIKVKNELTFDSSPIRYHTIGMLHSGQKVVFEGNKRHDYYPGTLFCFNQNTPLGFSHLPYQGKPYYTQLLLISNDDIERFKKIYPTTPTPLNSVFAVPTDKQLLEIWQRINDEYAKTNEQLHQHRLFELLLVLRQLGWEFVNPKNLSLAEQIEKIIIIDTAYDWQKTEIAERLNMSVSKLSRLLQAEQTTFSDLLKNTRMTQAIYLLLSAKYSVSEVACRCGYQSHSKFSAVFKATFGFPPSQVDNYKPESHLSD